MITLSEYFFHVFTAPIVIDSNVKAYASETFLQLASIFISAISYGHV